MRGLVYGVGINDVDYTVEVKISSTVNGVRHQTMVWKCPFYRKWRDMLHRCYSEKYLAKKPTYSGCSVCESWLKLSNFKAWMETQDWEGNHLDKDLMVRGNKVYSSDTCCFIPRIVNSFITEQTDKRGNLPIGVHWREDMMKFAASYSDPFTGKTCGLGSFDCEITAHKAWLRKKLEFAKSLSNLISDKKIADKLVHRYETYKLEGG